MILIILIITFSVLIYLIYYFFLDSKKCSPKDVKNIENNQINKEATYIGQNPSRQNLFIDNNAKHIFVCGTTGSGKTVVLSNFIYSSYHFNYPTLLIDGKGDTSNGSMLDICRQLGKYKKTYIIDLNNPNESDKYNPFRNANATIIKDMLINMTNWSEEHYKLNMERYLLKVINLLILSNIDLCFKTVVENLEINNFNNLSLQATKNKIITKKDHLQNLDLAKASEKIVNGAIARFSILLESDVGTIFDNDGIDIYSAMVENANIVFILNPLIYPELSPLFGKLVVIDSKKCVSNMFEDNRRKFFIFDEINVYASKSLVDLVNKSRSANVTSILATQSLSDLEEKESSKFKEQVIENCNNYLVLRQNSAINAEAWANIIGTKKSNDFTYQLNNKEHTGLGTMKSTKEYIFHPDLIKNLEVGKGLYISKDNKVKTKVKFNKPF